MLYVLEASVLEFDVSVSVSELGALDESVELVAELGVSVLLSEELSEVAVLLYLLEESAVELDIPVPLSELASVLLGESGVLMVELDTSALPSEVEKYCKEEDELVSVELDVSLEIGINADAIVWAEVAVDASVASVEKYVLATEEVEVLSSVDGLRLP